jgi:hypothetical protein
MAPFIAGLLRTIAISLTSGVSTFLLERKARKDEKLSASLNEDLLQNGTPGSESAPSKPRKRIARKSVARKEG